jgi:small subunit ribosomal protein S8
MTDPIADMLTRVRNALASSKPEVFAPFSKIKYAIAKTLEKEGFFDKVERILSRQKNSKDRFYELKITLKYQENSPTISGIKRVSKPGCRLYSGYKDVRRNNYKTMIVSTSRGIMTTLEAKKRKLGGEIICEIW